MAQADLNDVESSTILAFRHITDMGEGGLRGADKRRALADWLALLAASHPLDRWAAVGHAVVDVRMQGFLGFMTRV